MKKNIRRLFIAAFLSLTCFGVTFFWYHSSNSGNSATAGKKPIAFVDRTKDEIQRRPVTRIIWQLITDGEPVYPGEAIRTSSQGEVRIQFVDSSRFIDLEPDSLIVISQSSNKEISLDLMDGSLMVNQGSAAPADTDPGLKLQSGKTSVDLSQATAALSKTGGRVDLQILKGKAQVDANGQSQEIKSGKSGALGEDGVRFNSAQVEILSPALDRPFSQSPENPQSVDFAWRGFPSQALVTLEIGKNRKDLKTSGQSSDGKFSLKLPPGKHFWKLVAKDPQTQNTIGESSTYRLEVVNRYPPSLLSPAENDRIQKKADSPAVQFQWTRPEQAKTVLLEIAKDEMLKSKVLTQNFASEDKFSTELPDGKYFVRLSASFGDESKYFSGRIQSFQVTSQKIEPVQIQWLNADEKIQLPFSGLAVAPVTWSSEQKNQVKLWRVKVSSDDSERPDKQSQTFETADLNYKLNFKKPGRYLAMVEAVDASNTVLASSTPKAIEIELPPLLTAPRLQPEIGDLKADGDGKLQLKWNPIEGAKEYELTMIRPSSKENKTAKVTKNSTSMVNLLPGQFQIEIAAIDSFGRVGAKETRTVIVPDTSALATPKVKKIKVK